MEKTDSIDNRMMFLTTWLFGFVYFKQKTKMRNVMEIWKICWNFDVNEMQETILKENINLNKNMVVPQVIFSMSRWKLNKFSTIDNLKVVLVNFIAETSIMKEFFYRFIVLYFNHFSKNISLTNIF